MLLHLQYILVMPNVMHALLSSFLSENSLHLGVNEITSFQKLLRNLNKMITIANLGRQVP